MTFGQHSRRPGLKKPEENVQIVAVEEESFKDSEEFEEDQKFYQETEQKLDEGGIGPNQTNQQYIRDDTQSVSFSKSKISGISKGIS